MFVGIAELARSGRILEEKARVDYRTLPTRKLLNRCATARMPFAWTINPYRGCEFACLYCYARYTHEFMELRAPEDFETKIFAKEWDEAAFRAELRRVKPGELIGLGTATDPYQPAERRFLMTRRVLEVFAGEQRRRLWITTKSDLVRRDAGLLREIGKANPVQVNLTVTTLDAGLARKLEPLAPRPELRLAAVRELSADGIAVRVLSNPVMPGLNDSRESLLAVARAAVEAGATAWGAAPVFLKPCARQVFLPFLEREFPDLVELYDAEIGRNGFVSWAYKARISRMAREIRREVGLPDKDVEYVPVVEEQMSLFGGATAA